MPDERVRLGRRAFLALGIGAILGGCVQDSAPGFGGHETTRPTATQGKPTVTADGEPEETNRPETEPATTERNGITIGIDSNRDEPQATATVGGETSGRDQFEDTDSIFVWNNANTARHITATVEEKGASGPPLFRKTYRFKPDAYIVLDVLKSGEYAVTIGVDGKELKTVDFAVDDCNDQSLFITVTENGTIQSSGIGTTMGCMTVSIPQTQTTTADG